LAHPNIVRFLGIHISSKDQHYIVTEYVAQGSLADLLRKKEGGLEPQDLLAMFVVEDNFLTLF
jgi:serine/threonine protein kinase